MYYACIVALTLLAVWLLARPGDMASVRSGATGRQYRVRRAPDSQGAADRLAELESRLHRLLEGAARLVPGDARVEAIRTRWDGTLSEVQAADEVAFSLDKSSIHVCLRDAGGRLEDLNTSMFVLLHELAHVATDDYGHSPAFWDNMRFLLELAEQLGLYRYEDYGAGQVTFCGHPLGASPLTCVKDRTCTSLLPLLPQSA